MAQQEAISERCILDKLLSQPKGSLPIRGMFIAPTNLNQLPKMRYDGNPMILKSIMLEHCYARPYNWRPDANFLRPTKTLLMANNVGHKKIIHNDDDAEINVESLEPSPPITYDGLSAKWKMDECERHIAGIRESEAYDNWEEAVPKINWSSIQHNLFLSAVNILNIDRIGRLTYKDHPNEAVMRRIVVDRSAKRFRCLLCKFLWDAQLVKWVHDVFLHHLNAPFLSAYLDILQSLKEKIPTFVDSLLINASHNKNAALNSESLLHVLAKVWDPAEYSASQEKCKKLPGNPVLVIIPSGISLATNTYSNRFNRWLNYISNVSTIVTIQNTMVAHSRMTIMSCVDQMFTSTRAKVQQIKQDYPNRPIVLVGFNSGGTLALQIAQTEAVLCTITLGFSIFTAEGQRGTPEDNLLDLQSPVLFVIGQNANTVLQEQMEDIRERMKVETGLLVVGGADDYLRVRKKVKRIHGVTQCFIDRLIVDEIAEFIGGLLLSPFPPQIRQHPAYVLPEVIIKRNKVERKRQYSNGSSLDSEPPSPLPKKRPVGRPPKSRIDAKWVEFQQARNQGMGMHPNPMIMNKNLQPGARILPPNPGKQIKVLDNISINPGGQGKMGALRPEIPKRHYGSQISAVSHGNVVLLPDGRFKNTSTFPSSVPLRRNTISPLTKLLTQNYIPGSSLPSGQASTYAKYVAKKPRMKSIRKGPAFLNPSAISTSNMTPPSNLTSQDIMDLPIIFADDNQLLDESIQPKNISSAPQPAASSMQKPVKLMQPGKSLMILNRQFTPGSVAGIKSHILKRPASSSGGQNPVKYTKIILSKASEDVKRQALSKLAKGQDIINVDLENDLGANSIGKKFVIDKSTGNICTVENSASYKTEVMTSAIIVNNKIKQVIEKGISKETEATSS